MDLKLETLCFHCGQCCQHFRVSFYHGELAAHGADGVPQELVTQITPHLACMKGTEMGGKACIALTHSQTDGYRCSIYESRPSPCREFNILNNDGTENPDCKKLRERIGLGSIINPATR
jgi:Fe-S-cluster containining protein